MKKKVFVLYGGKSGEHDVSIASALNVLNALNKTYYDVFAIYMTREGKWTEPWKVGDTPISETDMRKTTTTSYTESLRTFLASGLDEQSIVFPVMHGTYGEDGKMQGLLDMLHIPYVGNGVAASAIAMDKVMSKELLNTHAIPQATFVAFTHAEYEEDESHCLQKAQDIVGVPCYVKPANMGSSIGISRCATKNELAQAILEAFRYDEKVLIEKEIVGKEVLIALTGNQNIRCSVSGEWQRDVSFFDYEDKYMDTNLTPIIPAQISDDTYSKLCAYAKTAFRALGCAGLLRADFFVTEDNDIYLNEVNTMPGFTAHSMFPLLVQKTEDCTYGELLDQLIMLGFARHDRNHRIQYTKEVTS
ncbi:D-alanine--D-alanine ligase family protein [Shouchella lonarensis]|uniref:D-alanine--D-alanine ligase n=1 Tax=Shouchella lonarensis TaxID=1464122 RepID=A0A1G6HTJ1_9BACI|nr:D-alanine--D-alanine ligase family protein [Shouchella lonarensis]SDB97155.1 D-alanine-D-alanine ligase [Shouchella lonarensis]